MEKELEDEVISLVASENNTSLKDMRKQIDSMSDAEIKQINDALDEIMETRLDLLFETSNPQSIKDQSQKKEESPEKVIKNVYKALEKQHPNFNKLSQDKQDELFINYVNEHDLYDKISD